MVSLNRMERGKGSEKCALDEIKELYGFPTTCDRIDVRCRRVPVQQGVPGQGRDR